MANRISKVTTRTGDDGTTGLGDGSRVRKTSGRIQAIGDVDELNSNIGVLLLHQMHDAHRARLLQIQNALFDLGGELSIPSYRAVTETHLETLDEGVSALNAALPPLREFILPGGSPASAHAHVCRTIARRAERSVAVLQDAGEDVSPLALQYLNRLSDLLFVLARVCNRDAGLPDVMWSRDAHAPKDQA